MENEKPKSKKITLDALADMMQRGFKDIHSDLVAHDKKMDEIAEKLNTVHDRVNLLMTKEEAISLFDMATLKTEHDHIKKILREKLHVEI